MKPSSHRPASLAVGLIPHSLLIYAKRSRLTGLSELFQLIGSGIGKVDMSAHTTSTRQAKRQSAEGRSALAARRMSGGGLVGPPNEPGSMTVLGRHLVKERETGIGKLERPAYVGRLVDD
jgi:hypothetical protein